MANLIVMSGTTEQAFAVSCRSPDALVFNTRQRQFTRVGRMRRLPNKTTDFLLALAGRGGAIALWDDLASQVWETCPVAGPDDPRGTMHAYCSKARPALHDLGLKITSWPCVGLRLEACFG